MTRCDGAAARFGLVLLVALALPAKGEREAEEKKEEEGGPRAYADVITSGAESQVGLFTVHAVDDALFFEIPNALLGRELLLVSRIARVPAELRGGTIAAGHKSAEQVLRFERVRNRLLVRKVSYRNVADPEQPIYRSVVNNNFFPIIASFDVEAEGPRPAEDDSTGERTPRTTAVIDVTAFFETDVPSISGLSSSVREEYEVKSLDRDRSFINEARAYPLNVNVRHTLTYEASKPPVDSSTRTISLEMHQSMILLPEEPMRARFADPRVGWFTIERKNFGLDEQKAAEEAIIQRWRLEPSDPEAYARGELVEPVKPIVYYLDPATPPRWRKHVRRGVEDWQSVFETAGFRNAIVALDAPEDDASWHGEDIRHSMVRWAANGVRNAMGPSVADPRSGEIIESDIVWYHNHMRTYRNRLLIETGAANPLARSLPIDQELMGEAIRQVIAHEIGHALGLPHNMMASAAYGVDELRDPAFVRREGISASIMEYARQNYVAQPGDGLEGADFIRQIGPYDHYAINWGYRVIPDARTPGDEKPVLDGWILEKAGDRVHRFGPERRGLAIDPRIQTEDLGDDPVRASGYAIANLKRIVPNLVEWTSSPGEDYSELREIYGELIWNFSRYLTHVVSVVGGVYQDLKAADQDGRVYEPVPPERQREAMAFLAEHAFTTPAWILDAEILRRIEHGGEIERVRSVQSRVLHQVLDPGRLRRLVESESFAGGDAYTISELFADVRGAIWGRSVGERSDPHRRTLQRVHLGRLLWLMTEEPNGSKDRLVHSTPVNLGTSDVRALARFELRALMVEARERASATEDGVIGAHYLDVAERIEMFLAGRALARE